jgi:integrase
VALWLGLKGNEVDKLTMNGDTRLIENTIIDFLIYLRDDREISSAAISNYVVALKYFYDTVNFEFPRLIDWRRIHKFIPEQEKIVKNDRPYTREEVAKMLSVSTEREAVVVLLQCAAGLRKGAIPALTLDDVKRYPEPNSLPKVYEIIVYRGTKYEYFSLTIPELSEAIENYLQFRRRFGEKEMGESTPLIREDFDVTDPFAAAHPKHVTESTIGRIILKLLYRTGLRVKKNSKQNNFPFMTKARHITAECHSLRKRFDTECTKAGMSILNVELLMGHSLKNLKHRYYKPEKGDIFEDYLRAVPQVRNFFMKRDGLEVCHEN